MTHKRIFLFDADSRKPCSKTDDMASNTALGFDTGLDARAFAQAQFAQAITEPGLIVRGGSAGLWKASGVFEFAGDDGRLSLVVWGPPFEGDHLDLLLNGDKDQALAAICLWIQAVMTAGENSLPAPFWPCAAMIESNGESKDHAIPAVFFTPPSLARRCIMADETARFSGGEWYVHPDLEGTDAAAFTAAAMLYRVLAGTPPFPTEEELLLRQDMREGHFLPIRFAVPGLNPGLAALVQKALGPVGKKNGVPGKVTAGRIGGSAGSAGSSPAGSFPGNSAAGGKIPGELLAFLQTGGRTVSAASLVQPLSEEDSLALEKEKKKYLKINTASVKTRRFIARNATALLVSVAIVIAAALIAQNLISAHANRPNTAGMNPAQVIESYYNAIGEMDHQMMEACVFRGAGKDDINMVANFYVIGKVRQAYEHTTLPLILSAREWQEMGGGPLIPMFLALLIYT